MSEDHPLLELQRLDSRADALRTRRAGLPERAELRDGEAEHAALELARRQAAERRAALAREEHRVENLVADLEAKAREVEANLYSGKVTVIRELEALQLELRDFERRRREREEEELAVMEQEERLDGEIAANDARCAALDAQAAALRATLAAAESEIDAEFGRVAEARATVVPNLPEALFSAYESLRVLPRLAGRAAARAEGGSCSGCHMALPTLVASRLQREPPDDVRCPHCGRMLVR